MRQLSVVEQRYQAVLAVISGGETVIDVAARFGALELLRSHPSWGPRRLHFELARRELEPLPSESAIYRRLVRHGQIAPEGWARRHRGGIR